MTKWEYLTAPILVHAATNVGGLLASGATRRRRRRRPVAVAIAAET